MEYGSDVFPTIFNIKKKMTYISRTIGTVEVNNTTAIDNILRYTDYNRSHFFLF